MTTSNLIAHVQDIVRPTDELPTTPATGDTLVPVAPVGGLRGDPPDWVRSPMTNGLPWVTGNQVAIVPGSGTQRPIDLSRIPLDPDSHAFYLPFHFYRQRWGIYVRARSVVELTAYLLKRPSLIGDHIEQAMARAVLQLLLGHETFHHFTELAISRLELVALEYMGGDSLYARNFFVKESINLEEGMANAYALREIERRVLPQLPHSLKSAVFANLSTFMEEQPEGYRAFRLYLKNPDFRQGQDDIITEAKVLSPQLRHLGGLDSVVHGRAHFVERTRPSVCPVTLVVETDVPMAILRPFPKRDGMQIYVYTRNEHPPPHFHLFIPPGSEHGSYSWPGLEPVGDSPGLTRKEQDRVKGYIRACQPTIYRKMRQVYPDVPDFQ